MTGRTTTSLWDRFAGFDPGLIRLTSALRAVLGTAATLALLTALRAPETALVGGGFTAMTTSLAISDLHPRNQLITLGLGLPLSLACLAVGTALTPYPTAAKLTFLVLICLAVQARRFGPRGLGLGIFGFMAFLLSQFAPARADQLPRLGASVLVAFGAVAIVRCCVGPVTGPGALRRLRHAFDVRLHDVLRDTASIVLATEQDVGTRSRSLQDRLDRLHESVLLIENLLAERAAGEDTEALRPHLSRVEVAAQRLAVLAVRAMHTPAARNDPAERTARQRLAQRIRALRYQPTVGTTRGAERCAEGYEGDSANWPTGSAFVLDCFPAVDELAEALRVLGPRGRPRARRTPSRKPASPTFGALPRRDTDEEGLKRGATRQAFQVTAASAIAITAGHLLSPHLWYWAVTAVWVVSIKNESTGEVLLQSLRRLAGTVIGVVFGYGLAALVNGDGPALLSLLLLCMFGIFYTPSHAYWAVTFFITGTLSMLLALTDTFSTHVLLLRVQETALGVSCGILAAVLVLPTTVRRAGDDALAGFLRALDHLLRAVASGSPGTETPTSRVHAAHDLDQALESFRKASLPLTHPFAPQRRRRHRARHLLELLDAGAYHVRSLAATAERLPAGHVPEYAMRLTAAADHAHETVTHLIRVTGDRPSTVSRVARPKVTTTLSLLSEEQRVCRSRLSLEYRLLLHIDRLDSTLTALVRALDPLAPDLDRTAVAPSERVDLQLPHGPAQAAAVSCADPADRCGRAQAG
ncbi:FUSC family protein [Streptomyces sp. ME02-6987-2C]|uniref:FUSC family protein n=1 Tax=unclassified Streptomyces TaxID=2593676 RepID=UPI0029BCD3D3|nr:MULTISPECIES: FUSC family protein [unclassified Streptomyces]MDX3371670.1 FUSC family protein [Streptomyces sp. ME02-6987-2C]MDX3426581.1 FUSC family protein [Streptomyces sp. ME02-6985-2c]